MSVNMNKRQRSLSPDSILIRPKPVPETVHCKTFDPILDGLDFDYAVSGEPYITVDQTTVYKGLDLSDKVHLHAAALMACRNNHALVLKELFRHGLKGVCKDHKQRPLFFHLKATEPFFQDCCLLFEAHGAALGHVCCNGTTLLHYCFSTPSSSVLPFYLGGKWYKSFVRANVKFLLDRGLTWSRQDAAGRLPLSLVACPVALESALKTGIDPNLAFSHRPAVPYLLKKCRKCCDLLLAHGLNPTTLVFDGVSALAFAVKHEGLVFLEAAFAHCKAWAALPCVPLDWTPAVLAVVTNASRSLQTLFNLGICAPADKVSFLFDTDAAQAETLSLATLAARKMRLGCLNVCVPALDFEEDLKAAQDALQHQLHLRSSDLAPGVMFHVEHSLHMLQERFAQVRTPCASQPAQA